MRIKDLFLHQPRSQEQGHCKIWKILYILIYISVWYLYVFDKADFETTPPWEEKRQKFDIFWWFQRVCEKQKDLLSSAENINSLALFSSSYFIVSYINWKIVKKCIYRSLSVVHWEKNLNHWILAFRGLLPKLHIFHIFKITQCAWWYF